MKRLIGLLLVLGLATQLSACFWPGVIHTGQGAPIKITLQHTARSPGDHGDYQSTSTLRLVMQPRYGDTIIRTNLFTPTHSAVYRCIPCP